MPPLRKRAVSTCVFLLFVAVPLLSPRSRAFKVYESYTEHTGSKRWCRSIVDPHWPFAYAKDSSSAVEEKGRVASNTQQLGHVCRTEGSLTKCFICEDIRCSADFSQECHSQIQGMDWSRLPSNVPVVSDTPWAVGGSHRNDFGSEHAQGVCVMLSGGHCVEPHFDDYSNCSVRCWGTDASSPPTLVLRRDATYHVYASPGHHHSSVNQSYPSPFNADDVPSNYPDEAFRNNVWFGTRELSWEFSKENDAGEGLKQGRVGTLAGSGEAGYTADSLGSVAKFNRPMGVAVDRRSMTYVADSLNHCIRRVSPPSGFFDGESFVTLYAGVPGSSGHDDGEAIGEAKFAEPQGVTIYYAEPSNEDSLVVVVADTGNHRIRKVWRPANQNLIVETLSGMKGELQVHPFYPTRQGFADGAPEEARFNAPVDVAVTVDGVVFVADKGNFVIREIQLDGTTTTLAGTVVPSEEEPGCPAPCAKGVSGRRDGSLNEARFHSPESVAIGPNNTVLVVDGHSVRRVNRRNVPSTIQGVLSRNRVVTVAGVGAISGEADGDGVTARFNNPRGVAMSADGYIYVADVANCRVRRLSSARQVAQLISCDTKATDVLRPSGCASYDPPTDALFDKATSFVGNVEYNRGHNFSRRVMNCLGTPPLARGIKETGETLGPREGTSSISFETAEDTGVDTIYRFRCPPGCSSSGGGVWGGAGSAGGAIYTDDSSICLAASHAGVVSLADGGLVLVAIRRESANFVGSPGGSDGVRSNARSGSWARTFAVEPYLDAVVEVRTIAGAPSAPLSSPCGHGDGDVPQNARFDKPSDVAVYVNASLDDDTWHTLVVADAEGNRIRTITSVCSKVCENGGRCVAADTCSCPAGWTGDDCTTPVCESGCPTGRHVCVGPDTCSCVPGYEGASCEDALCVQTCVNGRCAFPDTCACDAGWFDANCSTPVCSQTCGNGGNCTAPDRCTCPDAWIGDDCRVPVCDQTCENGGECIAPNTCRCPPEWSAYDCSQPVCNQGLFLPSDEMWGEYAAATENPFYWTQYTTCDYETWCAATNGFDCAQGQRDVVVEADEHDNCETIEIRANVVTPFVYAFASSSTTGNGHSAFMRESFPRPYDWDAGSEPWSAPGPADSDRQIALVRRRHVRQGRYVCANGGECVTHDTCKCASGWVGHDCRTPVCGQGYFGHFPETHWHARYPLWAGDVRGQGSYVCSLRTYSEWENPERDAVFEHVNFYSRFMDDPVEIVSADGTHGSSSPHTMGAEERAFWGLANGPSGWLATHRRVRGYDNDTREGWRRDGWWEIATSAADGNTWEKGACNTLYRRTCGASVEDVLAAAHDFIPYDRQDADAPLNWSRVDPSSMSAKLARLWNASTSPMVADDPANAWAPRVEYTPFREIATGRWFEEGGECTDYVSRGCFNRGVCVDANVCACARGWAGSDCSVPICEQECSHHGNCTHPNTCTCEKGWTGADCGVPLCAQDCVHGRCVAPDTCECDQWPNEFIDGMGRPIYRLPNGEPQFTGYTGFDCNTPICVQAHRFRQNTPEGELRLGGRSAYLFGDDPLNNINVDPALDVAPLLDNWDDGTIFSSIDNPLLLQNFIAQRAIKPSYFEFLDVDWTNLSVTSDPMEAGQLVRNDGFSFQAGCSDAASYTSRISMISQGSDVKRSDDFLCGVMVWEQGDYIDDGGRQGRVNHNFLERVGPLQWLQGNTTPYEGVYECENRGSCVAPDTCSCSDGYHGDRCDQPLCRHRNAYGEVVGCLNGGVCFKKDVCKCLRVPSLLANTDPQTEHERAMQIPRLARDKPDFMTGYIGTDCSIPICAQAVEFDPVCSLTLEWAWGGTAEVTSGGEGCFKCANGGFCTSPDHCSCPPEWTGHDCRTPVCKLLVDGDIVSNLMTVDPQKIRVFEMDPCGTSYQRSFSFGGYDFEYGRGNCTKPDHCTCLCTDRMDEDDDGNLLGEYPWQDPLDRDLKPGQVYGDEEGPCRAGHMGVLNSRDNTFLSCHLEIKVPTAWERNTQMFLIVLGSCGVVFCLLYCFIRRRLKLLEHRRKIERRRSRKSSMSVDGAAGKPGAFAH